MNETIPIADEEALVTETPAKSSLRYAWYVAVVLMVCNTLSFIDRQILGVLVTPIKLELGLSDTQMGLLQGLAFGIFYTLLGLPMGLIVDLSNCPNLVAVGIFLWSLMTGACAAARSLVLTVGLASLLSAVLFYATWKPYRTHYAQMHGR